MSGRALLPLGDLSRSMCVGMSLIRCAVIWISAASVQAGVEIGGRSARASSANVPRRRRTASSTAVRARDGGRCIRR